MRMKKVIPKRSVNRPTGAYPYAGVYALDSEDSKAVENEAKKTTDQIMRKARKTFLEIAA